MAFQITTSGAAFMSIPDQSKLEKFPELTETVTELEKFHRKARGRGPDKKPRQRRIGKEIMLLNKIVHRALQPDIRQALLDEIQRHVHFNETDDTLTRALFLAHWMRQTYMMWLPEVPKCKKCGQPMEQALYVKRKETVRTFKPNPASWTGYEPVPAENICGRVERWACATCSEVELHSRENDVLLIMKLKEGRCGEFNNLFVSFCLALGFKVRSIAAILDGDDHVFAELEQGGVWYPIDVSAEDPERLIKNRFLFEDWGWQLKRVYALELGKLPVNVADTYKRPKPEPQQVLETKDSNTSAA